MRATVTKSGHSKSVHDEKWFLPSRPSGTLWGEGTYNLERSRAGQETWDASCRVSPLIGGYEAMADIRVQFKAALIEARKLPFGTRARGHVYVCGWRFDSARDLHDPYDSAFGEADSDDSALGWLLRLMQAGITVRVMLWMPARILSETTLARHAQEHMYVARVIQAFSAQHMLREAGVPLGVCLLDRRVPRVAASRHQKITIIRVGSVNAAYCGGVDLAFTRRDTPDLSSNRPFPYSRDRPQFLGGDPQSGGDFMAAQPEDPHWIERHLDTAVRSPTKEPAADLPLQVYGIDHQYWHDQHVKIEGSAVATLERLFCERWNDESGKSPVVLDNSLLDKIGKAVGLNGPLGSAEVIVTTSDAMTSDRKGLSMLPTPSSVDPLSVASQAEDFAASVQLWCTVPLRRSGRNQRPICNGEFTVLSGVGNAVNMASELIWIFDQYFWSLPLAAQINSQLYHMPGLRAIVVVPPHADVVPEAAHWARRRAYDALGWLDPSKSGNSANDVRQQIGAYALWHARQNRGIYVHAKTHIYDASLLLIGSANCNARSYTGDTEIVAAVQGTPTIYAHMIRLWNVLLPESPWPWDTTSTSRAALPITEPGWGRTFFDAFAGEAEKGVASAGRPVNNVIRDPLFSGGALPNGVIPALSRRKYWLLNFASNILDARGIKASIETKGAPGAQGITPLIDVANLVANDANWRTAP
jgi:phosphatidylserine/phosphatidylglycerophosphate/cardiolipin synthase-like enzyme